MQTLISVERALNESCKQDFKHEYCLQDWRDFNSTFSHTSWATKGQVTANVKHNCMC